MLEKEICYVKIDGKRKRVCKGNCDFCGNYYESNSKRYCSSRCGTAHYHSINKRFIMSKEQMEVFEGIMFSDAGMEIKTNPRMHFVQCRKHQEYFLYIAKMFGLEDKFYSIKTQNTSENGIKNGHEFIESLRLKTIHSIDLLSEYYRWYKDGRKIIPVDLKISKNMLLNAYLGDGMLRKGGSYYGKYKCYQPVFCTNSFAEEEIRNIFIKKLSEIGIKSGIMWKYGNKKKYPMTYISRYSVKDFYEYIGECPFDCFKHKWISEL